MKKAFTLAEVLITLAIIGVVAAITIPSVITNTNQMEFKTGLRKAVSVLNQAITMNKALTGESPYDNSDLYNYLQQYMSVMKSKLSIYRGGPQNIGFYTTDGMRFEVPYGQSAGSSYYDFKLYESDVKLVDRIAIGVGLYPSSSSDTYGNCGAWGLAHNPDSTTTSPCVITVDVNGDRKPSPKRSSSSVWEIKGTTDGWSLYYVSVSDAANAYKYADPNGRLLSDVFSIMITDTSAVPYGVVAQKAMYQAQK